ncbi:hypothetical protein J7S33_23560, partial [Saccharothrix algeriensis]
MGFVLAANHFSAARTSVGAGLSRCFRLNAHPFSARRMTLSSGLPRVVESMTVVTFASISAMPLRELPADSS